jgi:hypothetical protein
MIETLLGVRVTTPGAATVAIEPPAFSDPSSPRAISGSVWTQRGTVAVSWRRVDGGYVLDAELPANVRAEVRIPDAHDAARVRASGAGAPRFERIEDGAAVFSVGSGSSHFQPRTPGEEGREPGPPTTPPGGGTPTTPPTRPAPPVRRGDRTKPALSALKLKASRVRARGTLALSLRLSERATVRVAVQRAVKGRWRASGKPVAARLAAGRRTLKLRLGARPAGRYRLTLVATDAAGNRGATKVVRFVVVRAKPAKR